MVTTLNQGTPARESGYEGVQYICGRVTAASVAAMNVKLGTLPAGCIPVAIHNRVITAFAGGTPLLTVGSNGPATYDNLNATMLEAAGSELLQSLATFTAPLAVDTDIYARLSGGPVTAGDAVISVWFIKPLA
jgi:hypothetical protein